MKTETLFKKLNEQGYATDGCLKWNVIDLEQGLINAGYEGVLASLSEQDKKMLLQTFFDQCSGYLTETIGELMVDYLSQFEQNPETLNLSKQPF